MKKILNHPHISFLHPDPPIFSIDMMMNSIKSLLALALILTLAVPTVGAALCSEAHEAQADTHHESHQVASQWTTVNAPDSCNGLMGCSVITIGNDTADRCVRDYSTGSSSFATPKTIQQVLQPPSTPPPKA